jgi:hypothetical protein
MIARLEASGTPLLQILGSFQSPESIASVAVSNRRPSNDSIRGFLLLRPETTRLVKNSPLQQLLAFLSSSNSERDRGIKIPLKHDTKRIEGQISPEPDAKKRERQRIR